MTIADRLQHRLDENARRTRYLTKQIERMGFVSVASHSQLALLNEERAETERAAHEIRCEFAADAEAA